MNIAITGTIASGKTTALKIFEEMGFYCFDTDEIVNDLYMKDTDFINTLSDHWRKDFSICNIRELKKNVSSIVFSDKKELTWLENIIHPRVLKTVKQRFTEHNMDDFVFCAVPLLFEVTWQKHFDASIALWTNYDLTNERLKKRGLNNNEIKKRISNQFSADKKVELADYVLINTTSISMLEKQCKILINKQCMKSL
ncbi:MAG: dephospho-CoA kinase [Verrucomicrobiota bacterium]|nr:dephospho-CoA kinase [Verrucomicrobiota bacterium]